MNIKDFVGPLLLAVGMTILFRSFWGWYKGPEINVGFVAPLSKVEQEPLYLEVDFEDDEKKVKEETVKVSTDYATFIFSNHGAVLSNLELIREMNGTKQTFTTLGQPPALEREMGAFLVALDEKTPYYYTLKEHIDDKDVIKVVYQVKGDNATVEKTFTIHKDRNEVELSLTVKPHGNQVIRSRIVFPSPFLEAIESEEQVNAISVDKSGSFIKTPEKKLNARAGFFAPELFGSENKYFIHSMVKDPDKFTKRAYYKSIDRRLLSFLEANPVDKETTWNLSFYVGPKSVASITPVSSTLDGALEYGFFSPIAKLMLYLLNLCNKYVHNYGFAIILITLLLKLLLLPFTFSGQQKMKKMQEYQKKLAYIQQRFKNDSEGLNHAREELIKKHGLPGMGGCLPLFLQIPFFVGLYSSLNNSIELYRAPFIFWIKDLSIPDPYYVLPFLIAVSAFLGSVAGQDSKGDFKQVFTAFAISLFLGAWTASMAAGLGLFIFANAFLHFVQTKGQQALGL